MGGGLDRFWPVGLSPTGRGHFVVSFRGSMAWSRRLDFMGRRLLCQKTLVAKMVSCKLDSHALLLRPRLCSSHSVTLDNFRFRVSYPDLDDSHPDFLSRRCSADENEQPLEPGQATA